MISKTNPVILITGCSSGIGRALAMELAKRGHQVVATARKPESIQDLEGDGILTLALDVTDSTSMQMAVGATTERFGAVDILVNNAGFGLMGPVIEISLDDLRRQFETNVVGAVAMMQLVVPIMVNAGGGRIVNIGSVSGITATPFSGAYCGSKAALHLLHDAMRVEVEPFGIDTILIQPGGIKSQFGENAASLIATYKEGESLYAEFAEGIVQRTQMSQDSPTSVEDFASKCADVILKKNPPLIWRYGHGSTLLPLVKTILPARTLDKILSGKFGLKKN